MECWRRASSASNELRVGAALGLLSVVCSSQSLASLLGKVVITDLRMASRRAAREEKAVAPEVLASARQSHVQARMSEMLQRTPAPYAQPLAGRLTEIGADEAVRGGSFSTTGTPTRNPLYI